MVRIHTGTAGGGYMIRFIRRMFLMDAHVCPWWLSSSLTIGLRSRVQNPAALLSPYVTPGDTVADIGCGPGFFTLALAELVGAEGRVIAVDIQRPMLDRMMKRAAAAGFDGRIVPQLAGEKSLGVTGGVDFALAFWMAHEVPDKGAFFAQIAAMLKPGARFLLVEPKFHVTASKYEKTVVAAVDAGLTLADEPYIWFSRAALFSR